VKLSTKPGGTKQGASRKSWGHGPPQSPLEPPLGIANLQ